MVEVRPAPAAALALGPNSPNPFSGRTSLAFGVPDGNAPVRVRIAVYDVSGRLERVLLDGDVAAGARQTVVWDGRTAGGAPAGPGVHFCRLTAGGKALTRKMLLMR